MKNPPPSQASPIPDVDPPALNFRAAAYWVPTAMITPWIDNPRDNDGSVDSVCESMKAFGFGRPIVARFEDHEIIAGHTALKAAIKLGLVEVPVRFIDIDLRKAHLYAVGDNRLAELARWVPKLLVADLKPYKPEELKLVGYSREELDKLLITVSSHMRTRVESTPGPTSDDDVPEAPVFVVSQIGDVWRLGSHVLACGNSLDGDFVRGLLEGVVPDAAFNDPPYGQRIVKAGSVGRPKAFGSKKDAADKAAGKGRVHGLGRAGKLQSGAGTVIATGVYAPIIGDDTTATAVASVRLLTELGVPAISSWGANMYASEIPDSRGWLVWDKNNTGDFANAELAWTNRDFPIRLFRHTWSGLVKDSETGERRIHPTQKPVALVEWTIATLSPGAKVVLDLFGGSGATLIACENGHRKAVVVELAPSYVDTMIARWEAKTGAKAVHVATGRTFDELAAARRAA